MARRVERIRDYRRRIKGYIVERGWRSRVVSAVCKRIPSYEWRCFRDQAYTEDEIFKLFVHCYMKPSGIADMGLKPEVFRQIHKITAPLEGKYEKSQFLDIAIEYLIGRYPPLIAPPKGPNIEIVGSVADIGHVKGTYYFCCSWDTAKMVVDHGSRCVENRDRTDFTCSTMMYLSADPTVALSIGELWKEVWGNEIALIAYSVPDLPMEFIFLDGNVVDISYLPHGFNKMTEIYSRVVSNNKYYDIHSFKSFKSPDMDWKEFVSINRCKKIGGEYLNFVLAPMTANPKEIAEYEAEPLSYDPPRMQIGVNDDNESRIVLDSWFKGVYIFDKIGAARPYNVAPRTWGPFLPMSDDDVVWLSRPGGTI